MQVARTFPGWVLPALAGLLLAGCGRTDAKFVIGMSQSNLAEPWRKQMNADVKAAAEKHPEIKVIFKNAQYESVRQADHVREFVEQGVDLLIISPNETVPLTDPVAEAYDAGIPVIVLDRAVNGDKYTCFIGANNVEIGRAAGEWLVKKLGGKGKVVELKGAMTTEPGKDRHRGFREAIKGTEIEVVFEPDMGWLQERAQQEMASALDVHDRIDAVYAHNDPGAYGAYLAAEAVGRHKGIIFVGIDALPTEGIPYVKSGILDATFYYPTGGAEAIDVALKILNGEKVPKNIELKSRIFTAENVNRGGEPLD